jgi:hypothetical protein
MRNHRLIGKVLKCDTGTFDWSTSKRNCRRNCYFIVGANKWLHCQAKHAMVEHRALHNVAAPNYANVSTVFGSSRVLPRSCTRDSGLKMSHKSATDQSTPSLACLVTSFDFDFVPCCVSGFLSVNLRHHPRNKIQGT